MAALGLRIDLRKSSSESQRADSTSSRASDSSSNKSSAAPASRESDEGFFAKYRQSRHSSFVGNSKAETPPPKQLERSESKASFAALHAVFEASKPTPEPSPAVVKKRAQSLVANRGASSSPAPRLSDKRDSSLDASRTTSLQRSQTAEAKRDAAVSPSRISSLRTKSVAVSRASASKPDLVVRKVVDAKPVVRRFNVTFKPTVGPVSKYSPESKSWQETTMTISPSSVVTFSALDTVSLALRAETVVVYWLVNISKTEKLFRIKIIDITECVIQVNSYANLDKWTKAFETHGCVVLRPLKQGPLVTVKDKAECYVILHADCLNQLKQATDVDFVRSVTIEDGGLVEILDNDSVCLWEASNDGESISLCVDNVWRLAIERAVSAKTQIKYPTALREGFLWRNAKRKNWVRQYCVLTHDSFYWFDKKSDQESTGVINLPPCADAASGLESSEPNSRKNTFWVSESGDESSGHAALFSARSAKDKDKWLASIADILESKQTRVNLLSIKEGYLYKRSTGGKWERKFFVLLMDQLLYFAKRTDTKFKAIDLNQGAEIALVPSGGEISGHRPGVFSVAENGDESGTRTYYLQAKDDGTRTQWLDVLKALVSTKDTRLNQLSVKEGYLLKEQRDKKKWNKRYFVLLASNETLIYFKKRNSSHPSCEIPITGAAEITQVDDNKEHKFSFFIAENGDEVGTRTYHIACDSALVRTQWVSAISKMIKSQVSRIFQDSLLEDYLWEYRTGTPAKKLFFALRPNQFVYFKKRNDSTQSGCIEIEDEAEIVMIDDGPHPFMFSVQRSGDDDERVMKVYAHDSASRDEWVNALRKQVHAGKKESPTSISEGYIFLWEGGQWRKKYLILETGSMSLLTKRKVQTACVKVEMDENTIVQLWDSTANKGDEDIKQDVTKYGPAPQILLFTPGHNKPLRLRTNDNPHSFAMLLIELCIKSEFPVKDDRSLKWGVLTVRDRVKTDVWTPHHVIVTKDRLWCLRNRNDEIPMALCSLEDTTQISISEVDGSLQLSDATEREVHVMFQSSQEQQSWLPAIMQSISTPNSVRHDLFGTSLNASFSISPFYNMPAVVVLCLQFLADSSSSVCLLQTAASHSLIRSYIQDFENGLDVMLADAPSAIACLRLYLVMLKEPIIPDEVVGSLIEALKGGNQAGIRTLIQEALSRLDINSGAVLNAVLHYFTREIYHREGSNVTCSQVANVWAHVLMRKGTDQESSAVLSELILNVEIYFPNATYPVRKLDPEKLQKLREDSKTITIDQVLLDKLGMDLFLQFTTETFVPENVNFLLAVRKYRALCLAPKPNRALCLASAVAICRDFIDPGAKLQLNVSSTLCQNALSLFHPKPPIRLTGTEFLQIETEVNVLLFTNEFPRFRASAAWDHWITYRRNKSREVKLPKVVASAQQLVQRDQKLRKQALIAQFESKT